jgi:hypothetical protein
MSNFQISRSCLQRIDETVPSVQLVYLAVCPKEECPGGLGVEKVETGTSACQA